VSGAEPPSSPEGLEPLEPPELLELELLELPGLLEPPEPLPFPAPDPLEPAPPLEPPRATGRKPVGELPGSVLQPMATATRNGTRLGRGDIP
jgi:hypothetical protein